MSSVVHVTNISPSTSEKEVREFFSFCGKITNLTLTPSGSAADSPLTATVTFEKPTAAKTALLLDNTQLGPNAVRVSGGQSLEEIAGTNAASADEARDEHNEHLEQEDKPRSRIFAEYLAHGYAISDQAIQKAIEVDNKHGFSSRFTAALADFDKKYKATDRAKGLDERYKFTGQAASGLQSLHSYFEKALDTNTGRKVREFYLQTDKQVRDIHNEARRLADLKSGKTTEEKPDPAATPADSSAPASTPATAPAPAPSSAPAPPSTEAEHAAPTDAPPTAS